MAGIFDQRLEAIKQSRSLLEGIGPQSRMWSRPGLQAFGGNNPHRPMQVPHYSYDLSGAIGGALGGIAQAVGNHYLNKQAAGIEEERAAAGQQGLDKFSEALRTQDPKFTNTGTDASNWDDQSYTPGKSADVGAAMQAAMEMSQLGGMPGAVGSNLLSGLSARQLPSWSPVKAGDRTEFVDTNSVAKPGSILSGVDPSVEAKFQNTLEAMQQKNKYDMDLLDNKLSSNELTTQWKLDNALALKSMPSISVHMPAAASAPAAVPATGKISGLRKDKDGDVYLDAGVQKNLSKTAEAADWGVKAMRAVEDLENAVKNPNLPASTSGELFSRSGGLLGGSLKPEATKALEQLEAARNALGGQLEDKRLKGNPSNMEGEKVLQVISVPSQTMENKVMALERLKASIKQDVARHNASLEQFDDDTQRHIKGHGIGRLDFDAPKTYAPYAGSKKIKKDAARAAEPAAAKPKYDPAVEKMLREDGLL